MFAYVISCILVTHSAETSNLEITFHEIGKGAGDSVIKALYYRPEGGGFQ
jgi:hypothetical protein